MNKSMRWILLPATVIVASLALSVRASTRLARRTKASKAARDESVREWENEGGALSRAAGQQGGRA